MIFVNVQIHLKKVGILLVDSLLKEGKVVFVVHVIYIIINFFVYVLCQLQREVLESSL